MDKWRNETLLKFVSIKFSVTIWKNIAKRKENCRHASTKRKEINKIDFTRGKLKDMRAQRDAFDKSLQQLKINNLDLLYDISRADLDSSGLFYLFSTYYQNDYISAIISLYPEHPWNVTKFKKVPLSVFDELSNQRKLFDSIAENYGIKKYSDWYQIKGKDFSYIRARIEYVLKEFYEGSLFKALSTIYSEHNWNYWRINQEEHSLEYWRDEKNVRAFFDFITKEFNIDNEEKWQQIPNQLIEENGGSNLLQLYDGQLILALLDAYPKGKWDISKFTKKTNCYGDKNFVRRILKWLAKKFELKNDMDWLTVTYSQFISVGLQPLLQHYGSIYQLINEFYPHVRTEGAPASKKVQSHLYRIVQEIFPNIEDIHSEFLHPLLTIGDRNRAMQLDVFIPSLNLAFEYQGAVHFASETMRLRDEHKRKLCEEHKITLIEVPYWWDLKLESIVATIHTYRPELVPDNGKEPIPIRDPLHMRDLGYWFNAPTSFILSKQQSRDILDNLARELNFTNWTDWYSIGKKELEAHGCSSLLRIYNGSYVKAIISVYNEHPWEIWKFLKVPMNFWDNPNNQRDFFDYIAKKFEINNWKDWNLIKHDDIKRNGGTYVLQLYGDNLDKVLSTLYPEYPIASLHGYSFWKTHNSKHQLRVFMYTQSLFPNEEIHMVLSHIYVVFTSQNHLVSLNNKNYEIDVAIPALKLGIEYQGEQHYSHLKTNTIMGSSEIDAIKQKACQEAGWSLIYIPYWWDGTSEQLVSTIRVLRPDLLTDVKYSTKPVSSTPPSSQNKRIK